MLLLGERIRSRRKVAGLSLRELGARTHLTPGFLSQVENDLVSPSLSSLQRIATALDVPMFTFLGNGDDYSPVVRAHERRKLNFSDPRLGYDLLTPTHARQMMVVMIHMEPGEHRITPPLAHPTEQWMMVLQGRMEIRILEKVHVLEPGDSIYYPGNDLAQFSALAGDELQVLCCITPPVL